MLPYQCYRRSLNALVVELLTDALADHDERSRLALRLDRDRRRVVPAMAVQVPSLDAAIRSTRGAGTAAGDALIEERSSR